MLDTRRYGRSMRIGTREVRLTNLDKAFFPKLGLTKGDLIQYYIDVAPHALRAVSRRPMHVSRFPQLTTTGPGLPRPRSADILVPL